MWKEFKEFILRGNVMELAVAVVMGGAFGAIVDSLVDDIFMPTIGVLLGGLDFSGLSIHVGDAAISYGNFIQAIVTFLIIAFAMFLFVRAYNRLLPVAEPVPEAPPEPTAEEKLLAEIRDLLKEQR